MAEQELKLDTGEDEADEDGGGGGSKKMIIMIVGVVLLIGISVGATFFLMGGLDDPAPVADVKEGAAGEEMAAEEVEELPIPAQYVPLMQEFVVNYQVGSRQRFLQVSIEIMTFKQSMVDALKLHDPLVRNEILKVLGRQEFNSLRSNEGRLLMQEELKTHLAAVLKKEAKVEGLEAVLFSNLVMQ